jgi:hypothetical protein
VLHNLLGEVLSWINDPKNKDMVIDISLGIFTFCMIMCAVLAILIDQN